MNLVSDIQPLIEKFQKGEAMSKKDISTVFSYITKQQEQQETDIQKTYNDYMDYVKRIKSILNKSEIEYHLDFIFIKSSENLSEEEKIILTRFINLVPKYRDKVFVYNDVVIYTPYTYVY